jgi:hypothetical protein
VTDPQRRQVRVRRSPKIGVFLLLGAIVGALVAIVAVNLTPPDPTVPAVQAIAFLVALLAPVGALLGGIVALLIDRSSERRARTVEAERIRPPRPPAAPRPKAAAEPATAERAPAAPSDDQAD